MIYLKFETINNILDVGAGQRLSEAQLFGKVDLCVELMKLLKKLLLRHWTFKDGAAMTEDIKHIIVVFSSFILLQQSNFLTLILK